MLKVFWSGPWKSDESPWIWYLFNLSLFWFCANLFPISDQNDKFYEEHITDQNSSSTYLHPYSRRYSTHLTPAWKIINKQLRKSIMSSFAHLQSTKNCYNVVKLCAIFFIIDYLLFRVSLSWSYRDCSKHGGSQNWHLSLIMSQMEDNAIQRFVNLLLKLELKWRPESVIHFTT